MKIKRKILSVFFAMVMLLTILSRTINAGIELLSMINEGW